MGPIQKLELYPKINGKPIPLPNLEALAERGEIPRRVVEEKIAQYDRLKNELEEVSVHKRLSSPCSSPSTCTCTLDCLPLPVLQNSFFLQVLKFMRTAAKKFTESLLKLNKEITLPFVRQLVQVRAANSSCEHSHGSARSIEDMAFLPSNSAQAIPLTVSQDIKESYPMEKELHNFMDEVQVGPNPAYFDTGVA
jgi:hypothetical protein